MLNFTAYTPTKVHFGKGVVNELPEVLGTLGKKVLLIYGKGSVVRNGYYNEVVEQLKKANADWVEYDGIKPNPVVEDADTAAELAIKNNVEVVVALGGGSVIDTAKIVSICIKEKVRAWDVMTNKHQAESAVPLVAILTLAATGTEMNKFAVLQNLQTKEKIGYGNDCVFPAHSFLDPSYTLTVPRNYTAYGITDLIAHTLENFFGAGDAPLSDQFSYAILKEAIDFGSKLLNNLQDYDLRARMMWAATMALNGTNNYGKSGGDWGVHGIGHNMSLLFDTPHGATLSVGYIGWMKLQKDRIPDRILLLGKNVFGVETVDETILAFADFFKRIESPIAFSDLGYTEEQKQELKALMIENKTSGYVHKLSTEDCEKVMELMN